MADLENDMIKKMILEDDPDAYSSEDEANFKGDIEYASDDSESN